MTIFVTKQTNKQTIKHFFPRKGNERSVRVSQILHQRTCQILEIDASKIKELKDFLCALIVGQVYSPMENE